MKILSVVSECTPLLKTGGLADVAGALPAALAAEGAEMRVMMPAYPGVAERLRRHWTTDAATRFGPARIMEGQADGLHLILIEAPALYARQGGGPYTGPDRRDWPDNHLRFGLLSWLGARLGTHGLRGWRPDVVHAHDWQAGLTPSYLRLSGPEAPPSVMTIHNIAYQGLFPAQTLEALGLPRAFWSPEHVEYWNQVGFLKAGLAHADRLTTVSPTYARELLTPRFGEGLDGLLRHRAGDLQGILNGIDATAWDPARDPLIAAPFAAPEGKAENRAALAARFGIEAPEGAPLFAVVSRMTRQKGLDLLLDALPALLDKGGALVVLGSGDEALEDAFQAAAAARPRQVGVRIGYDEGLAHQLQAGADALLVPSRFEPCGLTQLCALRYGALPVVARTGGLADTVIDANSAALRAGVATGFMHDPDDPAAMVEAIERVFETYAEPERWRRMVANALAHPVGWELSARRYMDLYRSLAPEAA